MRRRRRCGGAYKRSQSGVRATPGCGAARDLLVEDRFRAVVGIVLRRGVLPAGTVGAAAAVELFGLRSGGVNPVVTDVASRGVVPDVAGGDDRGCARAAVDREFTGGRPARNGG